MGVKRKGNNTDEEESKQEEERGSEGDKVFQLV